MPDSEINLVDQELVLATEDAVLAAPGQPAKSLRRLAAEGSLWMIGGYGLSQVLRLGSNLVLTRLLFPEAFGLLALVNTILLGLAMFSDVGLGPAIIRHNPSDDRDFYNTAWTVQVIRGLGLWIVSCLLAVPLAYFYREPQLAQFIAVAGLTTVISGFSTTNFFTANRDLRLAALACVELLSQMAAVVGMIAIAWYIRSVWSLVAGVLIAALVRVLAGQWLLAGQSNHFCWRRDAVHEMAHLGRWIFLSTTFAFLAVQSDRLILGRLISLEMLGVYSVAMAMLTAAFGVFDHLSVKVMMPAMVQASRNSFERFADLVIRSRRVFLQAAALVSAMFLLAAPSLIRILYDPRYHAAGWMSQLLCIGVWFALLQRASQPCILATDRVRALATSNGANIVVTLIFAPCGFWLAGTGGFIAGWALGNLAALIVLQFELESHAVPVRRQDILFTLYFAILCLSGIILRQILRVQMATNMPGWLADALATLCIGVVGSIVLIRSLKGSQYSNTKARADVLAG